MFQKLLIDGIVRQTTVLIAQLSTSTGLRAPLAHIANQVFFNLAQEIEAQGITRPVVADMFGMALRSYQKKTRRLEQSATEKTRTLWEAVYAFVSAAPQTRQRILERFHRDGEREVIAVLGDLVSSGLAFVSGAGSATTYGGTSENTRVAIQQNSNIDALANVIWLHLFHNGPTGMDSVRDFFKVDEADLTAAIRELRAGGHISGDNPRLVANNVVIELGETGKEAAMLDHFRAVSKVIASKAKSSPVDPTLGGATFVFSVFPDHPYATEVHALFTQHRAAVAELWKKVSQYNRSIELERDDADRVTFYLGQTMDSRDVAEAADQQF